MAASPNSVSQIPPNPLEKQWTGRGRYVRTKEIRDAASKARIKSGPKSPAIKQLTQRSCHAVIKQFDLIASLAVIYAEAWERKQLSLCVQMQESARDRLFGRPFQAINPAEDKKPGVQDNRLQVAIQNLIMPACEAQSKRKKRKALALNEARTEGPVTLEASEGVEST